MESQYDVRMAGEFLLIYICDFHVLSHLLLIYICKLHWIKVLTLAHIISHVSDFTDSIEQVEEMKIQVKKMKVIKNISYKLFGTDSAGTFSSDLHMKFPCLK